MLIALSGYRGSGKDSVADILCKKYGFIKLSFADELKREIAEKYDVPIELFYKHKDEYFPIFNMTPRELLIKEAKRNRSINDGYYVEKIKQTIIKLKNEKCHNIVISDMRFAVEYLELQQLGFKFWRVIRPGHVPNISEDQSEREYLSLAYSHIVNNDFGLDYLEEKIRITLWDEYIYTK